MRAKDILTEWNYPELTVEQEIAATGDDPLIEMANLSTATTGISGVIFISTKMASHGPRVKYFLKPGYNQPSFSVSISPTPAVVASNLPDRVVKRVSPQVIQWVGLNHGPLLEFWNEGVTWLDEQVTAFKNQLQKV